MIEIKKVGNRYYYFSRVHFRSFPMKKAEAELKLATCEAYLVAAFMNEPAGFQAMAEAVSAAEEVARERAAPASNMIDFASWKAAKIQLDMRVIMDQLGIDAEGWKMVQEAHCSGISVERVSP
ncbi:hypothetical protein ACFQI7_32915 [Paenibacillus allorhizosphaerae]|uniref:Uncharacterized protein n=1 Tax=Paenibacillus allorhizosphaerae TaxID=2849866 RepID=A0ABN7TXW2_9BACL|nr:hypothetical protein [Paenibacillus allorhizosphaerae]CAG7655036.1 hypothetical protein PAECIP111802_05988 [Paenibacillus allorhizosphaerae]